MTPEIIIAFGTAGAAIMAAFVGGTAGGRKGGEASLNGFKEEVRGNFTGIHAKLDGLTRTDGEHGARLEAVERIVDRRLSDSENVASERRSA